MELRGYHQESLHKSEEAIDIKASDPDSDETVLMHIVTKSNLKSGGIGVKKVEATEQILEEPGIDKVIVFGERFTNAARMKLREDSIEFFSKNHRIVSTLNHQELYSRLLDCINELCEMKCGYIPKSEAECEGYSETPITCSFCGGIGKLPKSPRYYREQSCPICGGVGLKENHYSCKVRLISDNTDFHFERDWIRLLQTDLSSLLQILRTLKTEQEEWLPLPLTHSSPLLSQEKEG